LIIFLLVLFHGVIGGVFGCKILLALLQSNKRTFCPSAVPCGPFASSTTTAAELLGPKHRDFLFECDMHKYTYLFLFT